MARLVIKHAQPVALHVTWLVLAAAPCSAQWMSKPGHGWLKVELAHHDTRTVFDTRGETVDIFAEGRAVTSTLSLTGAVGFLRGADLWIYLPVHRLRFDDVVDTRTRVGIGDPRIFIRLGPALVGLPPTPVAVRAGVKLPGSDFPVDAEVIPLSEGQIDYEILVEIGRSFYPLPLYAAGWVGYRWRTENERSTRRPGDERVGFLAVGGEVSNWTWKIAFDGFVGTTPRIFSIPVSSGKRELIQFMPTVGYKVFRGSLELGGRIPLHGKNLPAGPAFSIGYFLAF